jgi:hypothetical protein
LQTRKKARECTPKDMMTTAELGFNGTGLLYFFHTIPLVAFPNPSPVMGCIHKEDIV